MQQLGLAAPSGPRKRRRLSYGGPRRGAARRSGFGASPSWRRSRHPGDSGRSGLAAATGIHAPQLPLTDATPNGGVGECAIPDLPGLGCPGVTVCSKLMSERRRSSTWIIAFRITTTVPGLSAVPIASRWSVRNRVLPQDRDRPGARRVGSPAGKTADAKLTRLAGRSYAAPTNAMCNAPGKRSRREQGRRRKCSH
jgi:hypothetical protein